jgi:hypothetical protein
LTLNESLAGFTSSYVETLTSLSGYDAYNAASGSSQSASSSAFGTTSLTTPICVRMFYGACQTSIMGSILPPYGLSNSITFNLIPAPNASNYTFNFFDVEASVVAPEPGGLGPLGIALLGVLSLIRKRPKRKPA